MRSGDVEALSVVDGMVKRYVEQFPGVEIFPTDQLLEYVTRKQNDPTGSIAENIIIVDVREEPEMDVSIIPLAITRQEFEQDVIEKLDKNAAIVPYCTIGYRSAAYAKKLKELHGFANVRTGEGVIAWTYYSDHLVNRCTGANTKRVHTYGSQWNYVSPAFEGVQFTLWETFVKGIRDYFSI